MYFCAQSLTFALCPPLVGCVGERVLLPCCSPHHANWKRLPTSSQSESSASVYLCCWPVHRLTSHENTREVLWEVDMKLDGFALTDSISKWFFSTASFETRSKPTTASGENTRSKCLIHGGDSWTGVGRGTARAHGRGSKAHMSSALSKSMYRRLFLT